VLINTIHEHEHNVYNHFIDDDCIDELKPLFDTKTYDLIAKIKVDSLDQLRRYTEEIINQHYGVLDTKILS
jgi:hypothetical protein